MAGASTNPTPANPGRRRRYRSELSRNLIEKCTTVAATGVWIAGPPTRRFLLRAQKAHYTKYGAVQQPELQAL